MHERKMNQRELAQRSGLAESTISDYVHGNKMPTIRGVNNIALALNIGYYFLNGAVGWYILQW